MPYMNQCSSYLQEINIFSIIVRLGMSLIVGGILGTEHAKSMEVYLEHNSQFSLRKLSDFACENYFVLYDMQRGKVKTLEEEFGTLIFTVGTSQKFNHSDVLEKIYTLEGIEYIREIS